MNVFNYDYISPQNFVCICVRLPNLLAQGSTSDQAEA